MSKVLVDALQKIINQKLENGETDYRYAFNRNWHIATEALRTWKEPTTNEYLDGEFRMILSHAFLGEDQNISRKTFDLAISECVKFYLRKEPTGLNEKRLIQLLEKFWKRENPIEDFAGNTDGEKTKEQERIWAKIQIN